ncbi:MAG: metallophosphoesterase [Nocardioides sp.]
MPTRRTVLRGLGTAGGLLTAGAAAPRIAAHLTGYQDDPVFTFASLPDFFNGDVANLKKLPTWDHGANSVNASWREAIADCLGAVGAHEPDAVFVGGDQVEGHWNIDTQDRQLFGPVSQGTDPESLEMCRRAIRTAGDLHFDFYRRLFSDRDLTLYAAIGDHEILDDRSGPLNDRWSPSGFHKGVPDNRYYLVDHCKDVWADHFTRLPDGTSRFARRPVGTSSEHTAYAVSFADALTLITVDMFMRHSGGVRLGVFHGQLRWLRDEIRRAKRQGHTVIVQGHIPTMVPTRWYHSGRLQIPEHRASAFYQLIDREGVDVYLCGEVHDSTAIQHGRQAPLQVSHGCLFRDAFVFLVGRLYDDQRLELDLYEMVITEASPETGLWASDTNTQQRTFIKYGAPVHRGRLVRRNRTVLSATGKLAHYNRATDQQAIEDYPPPQLV